jgi:cytochrome c
MGSTVARPAWLKVSIIANKSSGITWNEASFEEYIKDPRAKVPGTKMVFAGIKNDKELKDLWAYLKQFAADGQKK